MKTTTFKRLDPVVKRGGDYLFCGHVLAPLEKLSGAVRYAVEDPFERIFIMNEAQLALVDARDQRRAVMQMLVRLEGWQKHTHGLAAEDAER